MKISLPSRWDCHIEKQEETIVLKVIRGKRENEKGRKKGEMTGGYLWTHYKKNDIMNNHPVVDTRLQGIPKHYSSCGNLE